MYMQKNNSFKGIKGINTMQGETIEAKVRRILNNKEPIKDGTPTLYTERKDGVKAGYNIRTDKWEIAAEAMDKVHKVNAERRIKKDIGEQAKENMKKEEKTETKPETGDNKDDGGAKPTDTTK